MTVKRLEWADAARVLSLLITAFFVVAAVLQAVLAFELLGPPPAGGGEFIDDIVATFEWEQSRWPIEFAASVLFALGFVALGGVGVLLSRLAGMTDARRSLAAAAYIGGGIIGLVSQAWWLGVKPVATGAQYCECGLREEEIMSRLMTLMIAGNVQLWLVIGAIALVSIGVLMVAPLGRWAGMGSGWAWLSYVTALGGLVASVLGVMGAYPWDQLAVLLVAGILIPIWALWLAMRAGTLEPPEAGPALEP